MTDSKPVLRTVLLVSHTGAALTYFETDRTEFPPLATYNRDRIFSLAFTGDLTTVAESDFEFPGGIEGAIYAETDCWRISTKTIDAPRPRRRRRRSAQIFNFPLKARPA